MKHLFLFTIGPVQSFIAQARKTQDLYAGSRILSELCKTGIRKAQSYQAEIIFPYIDADFNNTKSLPNRFLAIVPKHETMSFAKIGEAIEKAVREKWEFDADNILAKLLSEGKIKDISTIKNDFDAQIADHLEIYWIFEPITDNYSIAYERTEKLLGSVKNVRYFNQQIEQGRKCNLDGVNNALFFGKGSTVSNVTSTTIATGLNENEGLSGVSLMKRFFEMESFPSIAGIATMDAIFTAFKFDVALPEIIQYKKAVNELCNGNFDEQFLYEENLTPKYIIKNGYLKHKINRKGKTKEQIDIEKNEAANQVLEELKKSYESLINAIKPSNIKFGKYYAIIHFDGDQMGKLLSGKLLKDRESVDLQKFQNRLSQLLREFAKWASEKYLLAPKGKAVYAGGDDFLGFVNLRYLFEVMEELHCNFDCKVNKKLQEQYPLEKDGENYNFSFSAGIAIAHYKEPLNLVLSKAREAEKAAKDKSKGDRNTFCIIASKHSGENHQTYFKWQYNELGYVTTIANQLLQYRLNDQLSSKFFRVLGMEMRRFMEGTASHHFNPIIETELKRLMLRAKSDKITKSIVINLAEQVFRLFELRGNLNNLLQLLFIVDFIARELKFSEQLETAEIV
ncbi:MAG TPA: type III-B CRISPR-associated protein Cas10/Cmr2 [Chitinophagales bacterium]|nr:type III-B CRISPR-associated protein Cas10/Cmr2 [Chitinophagales bacterium]